MPRQSDMLIETKSRRGIGSSKTPVARIFWQTRHFISPRSDVRWKRQGLNGACHDITEVPAKILSFASFRKQSSLAFPRVCCWWNLSDENAFPESTFNSTAVQYLNSQLSATSATIVLFLNWFYLKFYSEKKSKI